MSTLTDRITNALDVSSNMNVTFLALMAAMVGSDPAAPLHLQLTSLFEDRELDVLLQETEGTDRFANAASGVLKGRLNSLIGAAPMATTALRSVDSNYKKPPVLDSKKVCEQFYQVPVLVRAKPEKVYGDYKDVKAVMLDLPFPLQLAWDKQVSVKRMQVNPLMHDALRDVFKAMSETFTLREMRESGVTLFGGCYNVRKIRGGKSMSSHSWAIALDINPESNRMTRDKNYIPKFWSDRVHQGMAHILHRYGFRTLSHDTMHWQFVPKKYRM